MSESDPLHPDDQFRDVQSGKTLATKIAFIFMLAGSLWILFSDSLVALVYPNIEQIHRFQTLKGLLFIVATTLFLYILIRRYLLSSDRLRQSLQDNQRTLTTLISNLPGTVYRCQNQPDWPMSYISENCEELTGYSPDDFLKGEVTWGELIVEEDEDYCWETVQEAIDQKEPFEIEYRLEDRAGNERWMYERGMGIFEDDQLIALEGFIEEITDVKRSKEAASRARDAAIFQARHDVLTGLPNRRWFLQRVERVLEEYSDTVAVSYAFCIIDLKNFKQINDFYGHWIGNKLLKFCGEWLNQGVEENDMIGRLGGDEFGVLMPVDRIDNLREQFQDKIGDLKRTFEIEDVTITQQINVGMAAFPEHGDSLESIITSANLALNRSKEISNRDIAVFQQTDRQMIEARVSAGEQILEALNNYRLRIYYQPIVDVRDGSIMMQEALLRILSPDGDMMTLGNFKEIVNDGRITSQLDRWIVRRILDETIDYIGSEAMPMISINLFPPSIVDRSFFAEIRDLIDEFDYPKSKVVIEISEKLLLSHTKHAKQNIIEATEEEDLLFALDDFGVGHGSFKTLKTLPLRFLKIDGTFIQNLPTNPVDQNFVGTIARLCQEIELDVVGEWIEDDDTSKLLQDIGVNFHQGYHYHRPQPLSHWLEATDGAS